MAKNVLSLNSEEAMDFFMKSEEYHGFELPEYFVLDKLLQNVRESIGDTPYEQCIRKGVKPDDIPDVNLDILLNKDGHYAVRPIILANPYLYYFLVRELCNEKSWKIIKDLFCKFNVPHIKSCALPVVPQKKESFHKSATIHNWWTSVEQRSVELSLEYRYMFTTDITNCYGSVNPQVFDWAFSLKGTNYEKSRINKISTNVQKYLSAFQGGRNICIPQGSAVFDFVGEIILGYSDLLLHEAIENAGITVQYEVIRYRDDYRVFCNDKDSLEKISYLLQHVLGSLNFRLNSRKTAISESIITDSIKPDKLAYIYNTPISNNKKGFDFDSFEKHLLYILMFSRKYPDSGSIKTLLSDLDKRVEQYLKCDDWEEVDLDLTDDKDKDKDKDNKPEDKPKGIFSELKTYNQKSRKIPGGSIRAMAAICTQIALENVGCCHYALRVLSRMVNSLDDEDEKWSIINRVYSKLCNQPNSDYNQLWLQNITYQQDKKNGSSPYTMRLCRIVAGDHDVKLWNNDWLKSSFTDSFEECMIVDKDILKSVTPVITFREQNIYSDMYYEPEDPEDTGEYEPYEPEDSEDTGEYEPYEPKDPVDDVDSREDDDYLP